MAKESEIYDMADRAYGGIAEPTFGERSVASGRADIIRRLRDVSIVYTRGALEFPHGQSRRAIAMCRNFDIVTHKMILSGGILLLYAEYMRPGGPGVCALFADELRRCLRGWSAPRDLPGELKEYSGISAMGEGGFCALSSTRHTVRRCAIFFRLRACCEFARCGDETLPADAV